MDRKRKLLEEEIEEELLADSDSDAYNSDACADDSDSVSEEDSAANLAKEWMIMQKKHKGTFKFIRGIMGLIADQAYCISECICYTFLGSKWYEST